MPKHRLFNSPHWLPDQGELANPGWLVAENLLPVGESSWIPDTPLASRVQLSSTDIRGMEIHPSHGTDGWKIYYGTNNKLREVEPATWTDTDRSGAVYTPDAVNGWQMVPYGSAMVAVGGHTQLPQIRAADTGNFEDLITNSQPDPVGWTQCWVEDNSAATYADVTRQMNDHGSLATCFPSAPAVNDALYFGRGLALPAALSIDVSVAGVGTYTITWQYYNGAWTALGGVTDGTSGFKTAGVGTVSYTLPTDSVALVINNSAAVHWIRAKVTAFTSMTTIAKVLQAGEFTSWPPKAKHCARWGNSLVLGNIQDVGPATAHAASNADPRLLWVSSETGRVFGSADSHIGERTTFIYLPSDGEISFMVGGEEFGAVGTPTEMFRVTYGGPFRHDIQLVEKAAGTIFPNGWCWANRHQLLYMSASGPAVMDQGGVRLIGENAFQRSLFDPSWVASGYNLNTDVSARYNLYCAYRPQIGVASWWYRRDQDYPDIVLNIHVPTGRASIGIRGRMKPSGTDYASVVYGTAAIPKTPNDFEGGTVLIGGTDGGGNHTLYEEISTGDVRWRHQPTLTTGLFERATSDGPMRDAVLYVRPRFSRNVGAVTLPDITVTLNPKQAPGLAADSADQKTQTLTSAQYASGKEGLFHLGGIPAFFNQLSMVFGDSDVANLGSLAEIEGVDIFYEPGGGLK